MKTLGIIAASVLALAVAVVVVVFLTIGGAHVSAYVAKQTLQPRITSQVFQPGNAIGSQAYFERLYTTVQGYEAQIPILSATYKATPSPYNQQTLQGAELTCVSTVEAYNAAAASISSAPFRSADLPPTLLPAVCSP